jgi:tetratricopeptide (TPR) repeat protein
MRSWTTKIFPWVAVVALLLIVARFALPVMGLAGADGEFVRPLVRLLPASILLFFGSVALIVFDLRRQSRFIDVRPKRLIDEAEEWNNEFKFGEVSPEKALGWQSLSREEPPAKPKAVNEEPVAFEAPPAFDADAVAPELERQLEEVFRRGFTDKHATAPAAAYVDVNFVAKAESKEEVWEAVEAPVALDSPSVGEGGGGRSDYRRVTADIPEFDPSEFEQDAESEEEYGESMGKTISEAVIARYQHLIETATAPAMTLFQLPPPPPEFAGRASELEDMLAARANPEIRVLGVQGLGGVGKTALALKLAEGLKAEYADAQFYIDLKGASPQPLSVAEAQAHVVRAFLPTVRLPENEAELNQLYHSLLGDKRALLLLDNVAGAPQVAPLIAPDGCLTIVTSRQHLALPDNFLLHLEGLPEAEARDLLLKLAPQVGGQADRIAELCGYVPLALRLAAGALLIDPNLKIDEYLDRLESMQASMRSLGRALRPVDVVLRLSYELLVPGLQKLWRVLAVFSDTFDLNAAASVWKLQPARAANAFDRLVAYNMVERNRATGRVRLHDLMAAYADARLSEEERAIARQRHSAHYQSVLHEADALYEQGGDLMKLGLDLVDLEWQNIQAGQVWAAANVDVNRGARELCNSYPDAGKFVLDLRQHPRERIRWSEAALEASKKMSRNKAAARHLIALGDSYTALSEIHHAIEFYDQALEMSRNARDRRGEAEALSGLGTAHYLGGGLARARELHKEAMTLFATINDQRGEASALGHLGLAHYAMGELKQASSLFDRQLALAREIRDRRNEATALGGLGVTQYAMGDARRAAELLNQQLAITREIGDRRGEAGALTNLGNACANLNYTGQAIAFHEQALTVAREIGDRRSEASALGGLGVSEFLAGNLDRSIELLESQLKLAREIGDRRGEALSLGNLGEALISAGQTSRAVDSLRQAVQINSQIGDVAGQAHSLFDLALALDKLGDRRQAIEQAETASRLYEIAEHQNVELVQKQLAAWRK